jgi:hypothetical protein
MHGAKVITVLCVSEMFRNTTEGLRNIYVRLL